MANSVPESALIEAAALQEVASVLPIGDPGRRELERQAALLRSRGVKFLAADESETEEQWARRMVAEAMRFPLAGTTRWIRVVMEIMHGVGGRRVKGPFGTNVSHAFDGSRGAIEQLSVIFNVDSASVFSAVEAKLDLLEEHISDGSRVSAYVSDANEISFFISTLTGMSRDRVEVENVLSRARKEQEAAVIGEKEIYLPRLGRDRDVGKRFYRALVSGDEAPLTPDDTLLFLFSYTLDVPEMLHIVFRLLLGGGIIPAASVYVIHGNTVLVSLPLRRMTIGDLPVEYPVSVTVAVPILLDLADRNELEIPIGGVFDIYVGRPVGIGFDRDLTRSIQEDYDRGQDESVEDVTEAAFEAVMSAIDSAKKQGYQVSDLTLVEDPSWFLEWIDAGHAILYDEFVVGVNIDAVRNPFKKLEKKWADYEADYGAPYPQMFKYREVAALWAVLKEKGVKPWKYSRRMNPPPPKKRKLAPRGRRR